MSGYPPPSPPPYNPNDWRAQQQAMRASQEAAKAQQRSYQNQQRAAYKLQRAQIRAQERAARRGSLVGPIILIAIGVVFLLTQTGTLSWTRTLAWYAHWWPAVMIGVGLLLVAEWAIGRQQQAAGKPYGGPILGGGVVFLLILAMVIGWSLRYFDNEDWAAHFHGMSHMMGDAHDSDDNMTSAIAPGQTLVIRNAHGDVTVTGASVDGQVHVSIHKQVYSWSDSDIDRKQNELQPVFSNDGAQLVLTVNNVDASSADLNLEIPHGTALTIESTHGNLDVSELHAPVTLTANHGDVELASIDGPVTLHINDGDKDVRGHSMTGPVTVQGHGGDMTFTDIGGSVALDGDFFGKTHLEHINGPVRFATSRTHFEAARLDGEFNVDTGSDLDADQLLGPVKLITHDRNITFDRVQGSIDITNRNGSVSVTNAPPLGAITIANQKGSVDIGVPEDAGFIVNATTRHGDLENDFDLSSTGDDDAQKYMKGTVRNGGSLVSASTTDGDITVRKSTVEPLSPTPPKPIIYDRPEPPKKPEKPAKAEKLEAPEKPTVKVPKSPKAPKSPPAPASPPTP